MVKTHRTQGFAGIYEPDNIDQNTFRDRGLYQLHRLYMEV